MSNPFLIEAMEHHQRLGGAPLEQCEVLIEWKKAGNACLISIDCTSRSSAFLFAYFSQQGWVLKRQLSEAQDEPDLVKVGYSTYHHETNLTNFRKRFLALPDGGLVA